MHRTNMSLSGLLALLAALAISCFSEEDHWHPPLGHVTGTVSEEGSAVAIDSAIVSGRFVPDTATVPFAVDTTDVVGRYKLIPGYYEGPVYVYAQKEGFAPAMSQAYFTKHYSVTVNIELVKR